MRRGDFATEAQRTPRTKPQRAQLLLGLFFAFLTIGAAAQTREFLTDSEIDQVREAQEPNDRMKLYVQFARARLDEIEKQLAAPVKSAKVPEERGDRIHDMLYEYGKILDAIDDLSDLAQTQKVLMRKGLDYVVHAEPEMLKRLQAVDEKNPPDREAYRFVLSEDIEATESSLEEMKKLLAKTPTDKKLEKDIEKERKQEQKDAKKPNPPSNPQ